MRFIDANVFIRHLTRDNLMMAEAAAALFARLEQNLEEAMTCEAVIVEIVYVLRSKNLYALSNDEIRDRLKPVLGLVGLRIPHRDVYFDALNLFAEQPALAFTDALCAAHMRRLGLTEIYTFDLRFDRISGVERRTPGSD